MKIVVLGILLTIFSGVSAKNGPNHSDMDKYHQAKYDFSYGVSDETTGDVKNHWEQRMGDVVRGKIRMRTNLCFAKTPFKLWIYIYRRLLVAGSRWLNSCCRILC